RQDRGGRRELDRTLFCVCDPRIAPDTQKYLVLRQPAQNLAPNCVPPLNIDKKFRRHIFILSAGGWDRPARPEPIPG
ncbi:hypothetical protein, partial [Mesorhizobium sp. B3-2-1]|uniref:hypothetical protein n=1 Tax=Mesorhizobium sp. B3-2-1 TaxID=2589891 RepID=UPI001AEEA093